MTVPGHAVLLDMPCSHCLQIIVQLSRSDLFYLIAHLVNIIVFCTTIPILLSA